MSDTYTSLTFDQGFFQNDTVTPSTASDLLAAVAAAEANVSSALTAEQNAANSASAAASSASSAAASVSSATSQASAAASSATAAASSSSAASTAETNAQTYANNASSSATAASTSATNSAASASAAASSATAASNSASSASTSASNASASATNAANSASTAGTSATDAANSASAAGNSATVAANISGAIGNRNLIHNPFFNVQQRGAGPWSAANTYTADRWLLDFFVDTNTVTMQALSDADRAAIGDERAVVAIQDVFTGSGNATDYSRIVQRIESVRRLSGKAVTVSFWARATSGSPKLGVSFDQNFGSGGSPSSYAPGIGQAMGPLSTTWTRYTLTFTVPSTSGKTFGTTAGTDFSQLNFWFSCGTTYGPDSGNIGGQSGTVQLWGAQLEVATSASALEQRDPGIDFVNCARFAYTGTAAVVGNAATASTWVGNVAPLPVNMRSIPTVSTVTGATTNTQGGVSVLPPGITKNSIMFYFTSAAAGDVSGDVTFTASADL